MRAWIAVAGVLALGVVTSGCTQGACSGAARYSAEARAEAPAPVVARRNAPAWPASPTPVARPPARSGGEIAYAPRTVAPAPIVLSSRPGATPSPAPVASAPAAPRSRSAAEIAARLRPINATCPVMLGTPVDSSVTTSYNGRVVAFADVASRAKWLNDPERYSWNLPAGAGFGSASDGPVFAASRPYVAAAAPPAPRVSATLASPELPALSSPAFTSPSMPTRPAPVASARPAPAPIAPPPPPVSVAAQPPPAPAEADAGGTCTDAECPGGNCALPPRRK